MVTFQQMQEEADIFSSKVNYESFKVSKLCGIILGVIAFIVFVVITALSVELSKYTGAKNLKNFTRYNSNSCPSLTGEFLLSTVEAGYSFEDYILDIFCRSGYTAFPKSIKCMRSGNFLVWSHLPVCLPISVNISNYKSITCRGNRFYTNCEMICQSGHVPFEPHPYNCSTSPCSRYIPKNENICYFCDDKCEDFHIYNKIASPKNILKELKCPENCTKVLIESNDLGLIGNSWSFGIYHFVGTHHGHPLFQNKVHNMYLHYSYIDEWIVGSELNSSSSTLQMRSKDSSSLLCPEDINSDNVEKLFLDITSDTDQGWKTDPDISVKCLKNYERKSNCPCFVYNVYYETSKNESIPSNVKSYLLNYTLNEKKGKDLDIISDLFENPIRRYNLYSPHVNQHVWILTYEFYDLYAFGVAKKDVDICPDDTRLEWRWYNTTENNLNIFVNDDKLKVKCIDPK